MINAADIIIDIIEEGKVTTDEIFKASFLLELIDYIQDNDHLAYKEYQDKTHFELLAHDSEFLKFANKIYNKFINSEEYNLYDFMYEFMEEGE